jgi:hypothetical protein
MDLNCLATSFLPGGNEYEDRDYHTLCFTFQLDRLVAGCQVWSHGRLSSQLYRKFNWCIWRGSHQPGIYALKRRVNIYLCLPGKEPVFTIPNATTITITGTGAIPIIPAPIRHGNGAHPNCPDKGRCCLILFHSNYRQIAIVKKLPEAQNK